MLKALKIDQRTETPMQAFDRMLSDPPSGTFPMSISPKLAEHMLTYNDRNRPLSAGVVREYARQMQERMWRYTRVPVIFSNQGRLIDGQHRLQACMESGVSLKADVAFGADDEAFYCIDIGKKRTSADIFSINGVKDAPLMAAATAWVVNYDSTGNMNRRGAADNRLTAYELYGEFCKYPGLHDSAWAGRLVAKSKIAPPSLVCALHYICARKSQRDADVFFRKVGEGIGWSSKNDPAFKLHKQLIENAIDQTKLTYPTIAAMFIKAWNASRGGRPIGKVDFQPDERFPRAI